MSEEAEQAEAVVDGDRDDAFASHAGAVVTRFGTVPRDEAAAVEIDEDGQTLVGGFGRGPDVEVEAIFAHAVGAKVHIGKDRKLHRAWAEFFRLAHAFPRFHRLRGLPAQLADRRL